VVGYLLMGLLVGPFTPGYVADPERIEVLANVGVVLLLFEVGIDLDLRALRNEPLGLLLGPSTVQAQHAPDTEEILSEDPDAAVRKAFDLLRAEPDPAVEAFFAGVRPIVTTQDAEFPGGVSALVSFIKETQVHPSTALSDGASGAAVIRFRVIETGELKDFEVIYATREDMATAAVAVLELMPKWRLHE
jgi:hypothetical protein